GLPAALKWRFTATHSILGAVTITAIVAACFAVVGRKRAAGSICIFRGLFVCLIAALLHLGLDVCSSYGVALLWPFSQRRFTFDLIAPLDPWLIVLLLAGILLPTLFRLVSEEIGASNKPRRGSRGAVIALTLLLVYVGGRAILHLRALNILNSRIYHG